MFCNCNPEACTIVQEKRDKIIWELKNIFGNNPCDDFVHKHSCEADCKFYQHVCFGGQKQHYCQGKRMNHQSLKWIKFVGCYSYEDKNGDNK